MQITTNIAFTLSMPQCNSWNGKWSGEKQNYVIVKKFNIRKNRNKVDEILNKGSYYYNFGDGWGANIDVKEINSNEAKQLKRKSNGFCSYDWMVESICNHGLIKI